MKNEYARMIYYAYKNLNAYNRLLFIFSAEDFNQAYRGCFTTSNTVLTAEHRPN